MSLRKLTKSQKESVAARQFFKCAASIENYQCPLWQRDNNKGIFGEEKYHIDHIIELWDGGTDDTDNLQALCLSCHSVKTKRSSQQRNKIDKKKNTSKKKYDLQKIFDKMDYIIEIRKDGMGIQYSSNYPKRSFIWKPKNADIIEPQTINFFKKNSIDYGFGIVNLFEFGVDVKMRKEILDDFKKIYSNILKSDFKVIENNCGYVFLYEFTLQDAIDIDKLNNITYLTIKTSSNI
jgi:5-methylcytosine-specific restriction protein A